jgi:hypothetical protein
VVLIGELGTDKWGNFNRHTTVRNMPENNWNITVKHTSPL